jgi:sulfite reductase alpha subunit-like flavoprotein
VKMLKASFALAAIAVLVSFPLTAQETAQSPDKQLASQLAQAAHSGDANAFLSLLSSDTRKAMTDAATAQSKLADAQKEFYAAAAQRFGASKGGGGARYPKDAAAALARFAAIEVTGAQRQSSSRMLLQVKTTVKEPDGTTTSSDDKLPAVLENGKWKLDLAALYRGMASRDSQKVAAYVAVTKQVQSGAFKDPAAAYVATLKAWRAPAAEGAPR